MMEDNNPQEDSFDEGMPTPNEPEIQSGQLSNKIDIAKVQNTAYAIKQEVGKVIIGQSKMVEELIIALLSDGHVLIEGVPGIAKTLTAKLMARTIDLDFSRIQFTPDLMPSDVLGTAVFNMKNSEFTFNKGPVFSNVILIDEINRAPAKTQAALFEVMEEKQATIDGKTYPMALPFFVMATQNPIEQEGTYKLPEAQLDRFLFRIKLHYPNLEEEMQILHQFKDDLKQTSAVNVKHVVNQTDIAECAALIEKVHIKDELVKYIAQIVDNTRNNGDLFLGASPRASLAILKTAKTRAAISGRDFVTPDDIQAMCYPVLNHRIILNPDKEMEGIKEEEVIKQIVEKIDVPR